VFIKFGAKSYFHPCNIIIISLILKIFFFQHGNGLIALLYHYFSVILIESSVCPCSVVGPSKMYVDIKRMALANCAGNTEEPWSLMLTGSHPMLRCHCSIIMLNMSIFSKRLSLISGYGEVPTEFQETFPHSHIRCRYP